MRLTVLACLAVLVTCLMLTGCGPCPATETKAAAPAPAPAPAKPQPAKEPAVVVSPCAVAGQAKTAGQYPGAGEIKLEKITPDFVYLNQEFVYRIEATNVGSAQLQNVVVTDTLAPNLKVNSTDPAAQMSAGAAKWALGTMNAGQKKVITVKAVATGPATISGCAEVTYDKPLCAEIKVLEPKLAAAVAAPKEVGLCDDIPVEYTVTNNGNAELCDVVLNAAVPAGVRSSQKTSVAMANIGPAKAQKATMVFRAEKPGTYTFGGSAEAQGGIKAQTNSVSVNVVNCALKAEASAPDMRYIGRDAKVEVKVTNAGNGVARDTVVTASARGASLSGASDNGMIAAGKATWRVGTLKPGESKMLSATLASGAAGEAVIDASASAECCPPATATAKTAFAGIPAILLEVVDVSDPIELGADETYIITVTNQGSAPDKNIKVMCKLDGNMQYISSSGPTAGTFKEGTIEFAPIASLEAKKQATYKVIVKALTAADARFYTQITSDMLTSIVSETESTHFYK